MIDLQSDICPIAGAGQLDRPFLELKGVEPEGQEVQAHNP
jgi:hypothetical protein